MIEFAAKAEATVFVSLLSVYGLLLGRYANQPDVLVGILSSGRVKAETGTRRRCCGLDMFPVVTFCMPPALPYVFLFNVFRAVAAQRH